MTLALNIGVLEKLVLGEPIPQEIKDAVVALRVRELEVNTLMDSITDEKQMKKFKFDRIEIESHKELLKSGRKM